MRSLTWHKIEASGGAPGGREGHTLTYSSAMDCYLLFGGIGTQRYKEVMSFSTVTKMWEPVLTSGKVPPERNAHVAWMDDDNQILYVHGGQSGKREALADLYALHLESNNWSRITLVEDQPEERAGHAAAKVQDRAFIFGGSSPANAFMKDLWSFNFGGVDWNSGRVNGQGWTNHPLRGQIPAGRKAHTMVSFEGKLYLFGGITELGYVNDLYCINTADFKCTKVSTKGNSPSPRAYHSATVMDNGFMALFGGLESIWDGKTEKLNILGDFYVLNLHDMRWTQQTVPTGMQGPSRRYGHVMEWGYCMEVGQIVLIGGIDRTHCVMDVFCLEDGKSQPSWTAQESEIRDRRGLSDSSSIQKQRIQELERQLQVSNQHIAVLEADKQKLSEALEGEKRAAKEEAKRMSKKIDFLERANKHRNDKVRELQETSRMNKDRADILLHRSEELEDIVKKAESLLITLDHSFNELISMNMHPHFRPLSKEKLDEISDRKKKHQECLVKLRSAYEDENKQLELLEEALEDRSDGAKEITAEDARVKGSEDLADDKPDNLQDSLEEDSDH